MKITPVTQNEFQEWQDLAQKLWPDCTTEHLLEILQSPRQAVFLAWGETGDAIGFMNLSLRYDYVPDASQSPVAFIEGIYVDSPYRHQGMGRALIEYAQQWSKSKGCVQIASDALLENTDSHAFHASVGFREVERVVFFIKPLLDGAGL
jgi:aminoglycoside 6'-N-acetyltransferase I